MSQFKHSLRMTLLVLVVGALLTTSGCSWFRRGKKAQPVTPPPAEQPITTPTTPDADKHPVIEGTEPFPEGTMSKVYFDYDKATIRPDQVAKLNKNVQYLKDNPRERVMIEGHCDERGTVEYNLNLGARRAAAVQEYFIKNGIALERITTVSKGEEQPVDPGHAEKAWKQNRRAEFLRIVARRGA